MYNWISRNILARVLDYSRGTTTISCLDSLEHSQWWPRDRVIALQNTRLQQLVKHAYDNVPYYHRIFDEKELKPEDIACGADLAKLPVLNKKIIRQNFKLLQAQNMSKGNLIHSFTSGSTGEPLRFISTKQDQYNWGYARGLRARSWAGCQLGDRVAEFRAEFGSGLSQESARNNLINRTKRSIRRIVSINPQDISQETLPLIARRLAAFQPAFLFGYPSGIYPLARYLEREGAANLGVAAVMIDGEQVFDYQMEVFRRVFNAETYSFYSSWEVHDIAAECAEHIGQHIAAENVIVEIVDDSGNPVPAGVEGRILLTNLHNFAMPFIRYDIGDTGAISDVVCPCGRVGLPLLVNLNGRADDVIFTRSGKQISGRSIPQRFLAELEVEQYQIVQESYEKLTIKLVVGRGWTIERLEHLVNKIKDQYQPIFGEEMEISFNYVDRIPCTRAGKRRVVVSYVVPDN